MKQLLNKLFNLIFFVCLFSNSYTQVKTKIFIDSIPEHFLATKSLNKKIITIDPSEEFYNLKKQNDENSNKKGLFKMALPTLVNIDFLKEAAVTENNGILIYSLMITVPSALSLSLKFNKFKLSQNSLLSIFTKNELTDSITTKESTEKASWGTRVYEGNTLNIVFKTPTYEKGQSILNIGQINLGYKKSPGRFGSPGASEPCNINVACTLGNGWEAERNSIALIQTPNGGFCTGVLIMNTCSSSIPYLLTANHCVDQGGNVPDWVFQFFYFSTSCNSNVGYREDVQFNGCTLRAKNAESDFALVQLNQTPASNSGIFYAGWNRSGQSVFFNATGIHHPNHDVMKISRSVSQVSALGPFGLSHWGVQWSQGITAAGSSGSPLFDQGHRIIGQLHDGGSFCATPNAPDYYGRFNYSWTGGGTNGTRLSNWLDPSVSNAITTNTTNISDLLRIPVEHNYIIDGNNLPCTNSNSTYQIGLNTLPTGSSVSWSVQPNDGTIGLSSTVGNSIDIIPNNPVLNQNYYLQADISFHGCTYTIYKNIIFQTNSFVGQIYGLQGWYNTLYGAALVEGDNYLYTGSGANYFEIWNEGINEQPNSSNWEFVSGTLASYTGGPHFIGFDLWWLGSVDAYYNYHYTDDCGNHSVPYHFMTSNSSPPYYRTQSPKQQYQLKISPNPAINFVNISVVEIDGNKKADSKTFDYNTQKIIRVYDKLGNLLIQRNEIIPKSGLRLNVSMLRPSDIYNIIIEDRNGLRLSGKLIKQ